MSSTNANPRFMLEAFAPLVKGSDGLYYRDYDNHALVEILRNAGYYTYDWKDDEQITTLSYSFFRNTTQYWMIQLYNGFLDAIEIEGGSQLRLPAPGDIQGGISAFLIENKIGTQVLI